MFDLLFLAYQADITRVVTFQIGRELSLRRIRRSACPRRTTTSRITASSPESDGEVHEDQRIPASALFAHLVDRMAATPDGDGSLLDHSMMLFGGGMGDGNVHSPHNLPIVLVGGGVRTAEGRTVT